MICEVPIRSSGFVRIKCAPYSTLPDDEQRFIAGLVDSMLTYATPRDEPATSGDHHTPRQNGEENG